MPAYPLFFALLKDLHPGAVAEHRFHPARKWRFDFAYVEEKVAIEVGGGIHTKGRHTRPKGYLADMDKYNTAAAMGWKVLRFAPSDLMKAVTLDTIKTCLNPAPAGRR